MNAIVKNLASSRSCQFLSLHAIFVLCAVYFLVSQQLIHFADDPGVGWHLATGAWISENGVPPTTDPFLALPSELQASRPWISDQWLSDLVIFALYLLGGWSLLYVLFALVFVAAILILPFYALRKRYSALALLFSSLAAYKMAEVHFILRPVVFGIACFSVLLCWLYRYSPERARLGAYAVLFCVWANLHPSFVLGLGAIGIWCLFNYRIGRCWLVLAIATIATLLNPYGLELHRSIIALGGSEYFMQLNSEWQPLQIHSLEGTIFAGCCIVLLAAQLHRVLRNSVEQRELWLLVVTALFALMTLRSVRILPFFSLLAIAPLAQAFTDLAGALKFRALSLTQSYASSLSSYERSSNSGGWCFILISILMLGVAVSDARVAGYDGKLGPSPTRYPYEAVDLLANRARTEKVTVISSPDYGGFITWFGGGAKPIIDDRNTLLGESFYKEFFAALRAQRDDPGTLAEYARGFKANYLLIPNTSTLIPLLKNNPSFTVLSEGRVATLFLISDRT